jgi:CheY-like chemotaxis protein
LVELCRRLAPDLVVNDFAMPGTDGLAAAAESSRRNRATSVPRKP